MSHIEKRGLIFFLFCTGVTLSIHLPHVDVTNMVLEIACRYCFSC